MKTLPFITVGTIIKEINDEYGKTISRPTFYRLEKDGVFAATRSVGKWRTFTRSEAEVIKRLIVENYNIEGSPRITRAVQTEAVVPTSGV